MKPNDLKTKLGKFASYLLYPRTEKQKRGKLPYPNRNAFYQYNLKGTRVTSKRIKSIIENCDHLVAELEEDKKRIRKLREDLRQSLNEIST